jgi:ABC-2 type transport system ATP-binding protein
MMNDWTIAAQGLVKESKTGGGAVTPAAGLDLAIAPGEIYGLIGPDGAGKTTATHVLLGLLRPTSGSIHVLGLNSATRTKEVHARVG